MKRAQTPSFILEKKLLASERDEQLLAKCFKYAWQIKVQLTKHARRQLKKLSLDKRYHELLITLKELRVKDRVNKDAACRRKIKTAERELNSLRTGYGLTQFQFRLWIQPLQHRYGKYIDSRTAQCIADDIWKAVDKYLFDNGNKIHMPQLDGTLSIESNDNKTGIRCRNGRILWKSLDIGISRDKRNDYENEALTCRVKYCRIVRKQFPGRWHYYVQLVMEGVPPQKHAIGTGRVGIDPGTLSMAVASEGKCMLTALNEGTADYSREINRLNRAMDRSRRFMNPGNYNSDGTVKKGRRHWVFSKTYRALSRKKRALERKQAASLKNHHETLANDILSLGDDIYTEEMNYKGLQRRKKETTVNSRGRYDSKKRFGRSLKNGAPAMLLGIIDRKLRYEGRELHKVNTRTFRASQYNHVTDEYIKKRMSRRHNIIEGKWVQRDLYSAFLIMNSADDLLHTDRALCIEGYDTFLKNHDRCVDDLRNSSCKLLSSYGIHRAA